MSGLLINKYDRNLLLVTGFLKSVPELNDLYHLIQNNTSVTKEMVGNQARILNIQSRLGEWIRTSLLKWKVDETNSPYKPKKEEVAEEKFTCAFCGAKLTSSVFYIKNIDTDEEFTLGGTCKEKLDQDSPEFMVNSKFAKTENEQRNYERLLGWYPFVERVLSNGKGFISTFEYVTPEDLYQQFLTNFEQINRICKNYIRNGRFPKTCSELEQAIKNYRRVASKIRQFETIAKKNPNKHLDRLTILNERRIQGAESLQNIVSDVRKNNGLISCEIGARIRNVEFLNQFCSYIAADMFKKGLAVTVIDVGELGLTFKINQRQYKFNINSRYLIQAYNFPDANVTPNSTVLARDVSSFLRPEKSTVRQFVKQFEQGVATYSEFRKHEFNSENIWKSNSSETTINWLDNNYGDRLFYEMSPDSLLEISFEKLIQVMTLRMLKRWLGIKNTKMVDLSDVSKHSWHKQELLKKIRRDFEIEKERTRSVF